MKRSSNLACFLSLLRGCNNFRFRIWFRLGFWGWPWWQILASIQRSKHLKWALNRERLLVMNPSHTAQRIFNFNQNRQWKWCCCMPHKSMPKLYGILVRTPCANQTKNNIATPNSVMESQRKVLLLFFSGRQPSPSQQLCIDWISSGQSLGRAIKIDPSSLHR